MLLILVFCALSYIVPGGEFQLDDNKRAIAGTFQFVGQNPVSPWQALLSIKKGIVGSASTISLLLICGGSLAVVISTGCFEEMINYGIYRLEDKSVIVLVPAIVTLMSLLGAFAGNDSMIAFVTVGHLLKTETGQNLCYVNVLFRIPDWSGSFFYIYFADHSTVYL